MNKFSGRKAIVVGASSGMGREVARLLLRDGWTVGLVARREALLDSLAKEFIKKDRLSDNSSTEQNVKALVREIDVTSEEADTSLRQLIDDMGGIDLYFHAAGVGWQNHDLEKCKELRTVAVNGLGFARMVGEAYRYFATVGHGHIAVISSIAVTKGLCAALIDDGARYPMVLDPVDVAKQIVVAIYRQRHVVVIDWRWRVLTFFWRLLPDWVWRRLNIHT